MIRTTLAPSRLTLILVALLALGPGLTDPRGQPKACGSDIRPIEVNQTTLHYFECGTGEPLVFVHGGLGDLRTFREQVEAFAASFRVIAYSRRYYPPNTPPQAGDNSSLGVNVADLTVLLKVLKATPAHLVGNSYGAYIALALAIEQPNLVRSLVLGEPPILPLLSRSSLGKAARESWHRRVLDPARKALDSGNVEEGLRQFLDGICATPCFGRIPQARRTELVEKHGPTFRLDMPTDMSGVMPPFACEKSRELRHPTLLVTGERTDLVFVVITAELEGCLKDPSVVMVPQAAHSPQQENPTFYNKAVLGFVQRR
jgi:pimeloyl-ACP methyl ester carboxylesterase